MTKYCSRFTHSGF